MTKTNEEIMNQILAQLNQTIKVVQGYIKEDKKKIAEAKKSRLA